MYLKILKIELHFLHKDLKSNFEFSHHKERQFLRLWHYHPEIELVYIKQGKGTLFAGDFIGTFEEGNLFLIGKNIPHMFQSSSKNFSEAYVLHFNQSFFEAIKSNKEEFQYIKLIHNLSERGSTFHNFRKNEIENLLFQLRDLPIPLKAINILQIFYSLSINANKTYLGSLNWLNHHQVSDQRLSEVMEFLMLNFKEDISLEKIAGIAGMNKTAFCRFFKQHTGKSFITYLNELRINYSCKLLKEVNSNYSISKSCYASGFNSLSYYNRVFKKSIGITPSQYRNNKNENL